MNRQGNDEVHLRLHMGCGESLCSRLLLRVPRTALRVSIKQTRKDDHRHPPGRARP